MAPRYDFYQTEAKVVIDILLKDAKDKNYNLRIDEQEVQLTADGDINVVIPLYTPIDASKSTHKVMSTKIEVILYKLESITWPTLEQKQPEAEVKVVSKKEPKNWDQMAKEAEKADEEAEREEKALAILFQKIYGNADEATRRAMNKSYFESGGTVLSTNWNEVGGQKVEVKPPDGCEFKTFNS